MGSYLAHPAALLTVTLEQREQLMTFSVFKAKLMTSPNLGIQCTPLPDSGPQQPGMQALGLAVMPCQGREGNP